MIAIWTRNYTEWGDNGPKHKLANNAKVPNEGDGTGVRSRFS